TIGARSRARSRVLSIPPPGAGSGHDARTRSTPARGTNRHRSTSAEERCHVTSSPRSSTTSLEESELMDTVASRIARFLAAVDTEAVFFVPTVLSRTLYEIEQL